MFTPTETQIKELLNLWFSYDSLFVAHWIEYIKDDFKIKYWYSWKSWHIGKYNSIEIFPESIEDIQTLIRLLSPNSN